MLQCSLTDPPAANETIMASAGLTSIGGNEVDAGTLITLAPKTLYFGAGNYSVPQPLNISRGISFNSLYGDMAASISKRHNVIVQHILALDRQGSCSC